MACSFLCHISNACEIERSLIPAHVSKIRIRIMVKGVKWSGLASQGGKTNQIIVEGVIWTSDTLRVKWTLS
jgi:hypothetical protein